MTAILEKIRNAENLPSLPTVAVQVLTMTQADDLSVSEIARVIQQDPALTGRLLKIVNSSLFGMSRKISSLQQAMVVLGLRTVKVMVLSFSLVDTMRSRKGGGFDFAAYWRRSLTTAVTSRLLAEQVHKAISDEAFVSGLLCDLGILAAFQCAHELYEPVLVKYESGFEPFQTVEQSVLGVTHQELSAELLNHWSLPETLCNAVRSHHAPVGDPIPANAAEPMLTRVLRAAAIIADLFCADIRAGTLDTIKGQIVEQLPIEEGALSEVLTALDSHVKETASLFALSIGPTRNYQEIQAEACVQLARLTMAAELERAQIAQREQAVRRQVEELNDENQKLAHQATVDALTSIGNRAALQQRLDREFAAAAKSGNPVYMLLLDLDRFKKLNDTFGHQTGDEALRQVGNCLKRLSGGCFPARYGGEEFAVLAPNVSAAEVRELAERIRIGVQQLRIPHGTKFVSITTSVGIGSISPDEAGFKPRELIERADRCLYDAKHSGRNRVIMMEESAAASKG